jgi:hypothetical protein
MKGKTMSDLEKLAREKKIPGILGKVTLKQDKMRILLESRLPQFGGIILPYSEFNRDNNELIKFMEEHRELRDGFCVRALPNLDGIDLGFTRRFKYGFLSFKDCKCFLSGAIKDKKDCYDVGLTSWLPNLYGGVIVSGKEQVVGELGRKVNKITAGEETPLASLVIDKERGEQWYKEDEGKDCLCNALSIINRTFESIWDKGYFEFVAITSEDIRFIDYDSKYRV